MNHVWGRLAERKLSGLQRVSLGALTSLTLVMSGIPGAEAAQTAAPGDPLACTISSAKRVITGTNGHDVICVTGMGRHVVDARGGNDIVRGGPGAEVIRGGSGDDQIDGGGGKDQVIGGLGEDTCTKAYRTSCEHILELNALGEDVTLTRIDQQTLAATVNPEGESSLTLAPGSPAQVGDVLNSGPTDLLPDGFLGRITGVSSGPAGSVVQTAPVTLPEIVPYGQFDLIDSGELPPADQPQTTLSAKSAAVSAAAAGLPAVEEGFTCEGKAEAKVKASLGLTRDISAGAAWLPFKGTAAYFNGTVTLKGEAGLGIDGGASCEWSKHLAGPSLGKKVILVGPAVVVYDITTGLDLKATIAAEAGFDVTGTIEAGVNYTASDNDGVFAHNLEPIRDAGITATAKGNIGGRLDALARIGLRAYGSAGPDITFGPYLDAKAEVTADPWLTVDGGVRAGLHLVFKVWKVDVHHTLVEGDLVRIRLYELGGTPPTTTPPTTPSGLTGATAISAGAAHSCALINDGTARCWGLNDYGQLGNGSTTDSTTPVTVSGLTGVTAISAGANHSCALINDGTARCWGWNGNGATGIGEGETTNSTTPVTVSGLTGATAISAGGYHRCALINDGTARCWGGLGNDGPTYGMEPVTVSGLTGATAISAGTEHSCALINDGTARCWGANDSGELGNGDTVYSATPVTVSGLTGVTAISAGGYHSCALINDGTARCWGWNFSREFGNDDTTNSTTPVTVSGLTGVTAISAGGSHSCALINDGTARCWGLNDYGQLGNGSSTDSLTPVVVLNQL